MSVTDRTGLLGREREREAIAALLDRARRGDSGAMVMVGPAGAGKTTLLLEASRLGAGREPPLAILRARGIESEAEVAFAGLLELVRPLANLIPELPGPQARALEGALALAPTEATDRFSVSAATLAILALAATDGPLMVIVDDLHWLDPPSAQAILFAARRLLHEGIAILLCSRPEPHVSAQIEGLPVLDVGPLNAEEAGTLARAVAARDLGDDEVDALVTGTGGNPLAIVEAAREIGQPGRSPASVFLPLPVAERIRAGVERRLDGLGDAERRAVLIAATAGTRSSSALIDTALAGQGISMDALDAAEREGVLRVGSDVVEFEHPLTRSAAYASAGSRDQRAAHRALAAASREGSAERAWHLAAAAIGPDEDAARALELAGQDALVRGAPSTAGRAFDRAAALSEDAETAARRLLLSGGAARLAGNPDHAREVITLARERSRDPLTRADALGLLFQMDTWRAPVATARSIATEVEQLARLDRTRAARMLAEAATALARSGSIPLGVEFAARAQAEIAAQGTTDDAVELAVLFTQVMDARAPEAVEPLVALGERLLSAPPSAHTLALLQQVAWVETWTEQYEAAGVLLDHAVAVGRAQAPGTLPMALATRGELGYRQGRFHLALADTTEAASLAADFAQPHPRGLALTCQARIEACLGRDGDCRASAAEAARIGRELGGEESPIAAWGSPALGILELGRGRPHAAIPPLEMVVTSFRHGGIREPGVVLAAGDLIEAYSRAGRRDQARELLDEFGTLARRTRRTGAQAIAERCRGLLAGPRDFEGPFNEALRLHRAVNMPFERARTHLAFGEALNAAGQPGVAASHLEEALAVFDRLGVERWSVRASRELGARGGAASAQPTSASDALTPRELRVALVAASGATRAEAGAQLLVSAKTIDAHLGRIYRKLGVRSQAELAARVVPALGDRALAITSFGEFTVARDGRVLGDEELGGTHGRQVLAALLAARGPVALDTLARWVWPALDDDGAARALEEALDTLTRTLGPTRFSRDGSDLRFVLGDGGDWDALRLLAAGRDPDGAATSLADIEDTLAAFSAPLFPEWPEAEWARALEATCVEALSTLRGRLADTLLQDGRHRDALQHYSALSEADPSEESWHRGVMRCHAASGDLALALRQYHACRSAVRQAKGRDPDQQTRQLYMELLARR